MALRRLQREYQSILKNPLPLCKIIPSDNLEWRAIITGPTNTPYSGGFFELSLKFPENYPNKNPEVNFVTPIYHPNINEKGRICVSLWDKWLPTHNIATVILALIALLSHPNPDSRLNGAAGDLYKNKPEEYKKEAQRWTKKYAGQD